MSVQAARILVTEQILSLRLGADGELHRWIGPALRGLAAARLKEMSCRHPARERETRWVHCDGCPHQPVCEYARLFEPLLATTATAPSVSDGPASEATKGLPPGVRLSVLEPEEGRRGPGPATPRDELRMCVLAPYFPLAGRVVGGMQVPVRVITAGAQSDTEAMALLAALRATGERGGIGPHRIPFTVEAGPIGNYGFGPPDLPSAPDQVAGQAPRMALALLGPLFLKQRQGTRRLPRLQPTMRDILMASIRTVQRMFHVCGIAINVDADRFEAASRHVGTDVVEWSVFNQDRRSSRTGDRYAVIGVEGWCVFRAVPWSFLPWLTWGGILGVGEHRVCGAGRWRLLIE